ncbi:MAG: histidine phosphatase family protein [Spirochaetia bacterium]
MNVFFIRHCEAQSNASHILAGQREFPLTHNGQIHALHIAQMLKQQIPHVSTIYVSPQQRTQQTAQPLCNIFGLVPTEIEELKEQDWGKFSGRTYQELKNDPDFEHPKNRNWAFHPPGGESYEAVRIRLEYFFAHIPPFPPDANIICVTHGGTMRIIRGILEQTTPLYTPDVPANGEVWYVEDCRPQQRYHTIEIRKLGGEILHSM